MSAFLNRVMSVLLKLPEVYTYVSYQSFLKIRFKYYLLLAPVRLSRCRPASQFSSSTSATQFKVQVHCSRTFLRLGLSCVCVCVCLRGTAQTTTHFSHLFYPHVGQNSALDLWLIHHMSSSHCAKCQHMAVVKSINTHLQETLSPLSLRLVLKLLCLL